MFGENADVPASSTSSSVPLPLPRSPPLHIILSISLQSFLSHVLNPFQPSLCSSLLRSPLPFSFGVTLRTGALPLGGTKRSSRVPCHCCAETRPSQRTNNRTNRKGNKAHTIGGTLWGIMVTNIGSMQPVCCCSSV